ncbi:MAG: hypothetical protein OEZ42_09525, partial [Gemmatimonadota bacterium]|nr:hypothetical protein [Gemmatimonadota bacterium]
ERGTPTKERAEIPLHKAQREPAGRPDFRDTPPSSFPPPPLSQRQLPWQTYAVPDGTGTILI